MLVAAPGSALRGQAVLVPSEPVPSSHATGSPLPGHAPEPTVAPSPASAASPPSVASGPPCAASDGLPPSAPVSVAAAASLAVDPAGAGVEPQPAGSKQTASPREGSKRVGGRTLVMPESSARSVPRAGGSALRTLRAPWGWLARANRGRRAVRASRTPDPRRASWTCAVLWQEDHPRGEKPAAPARGQS